MDELLEIHMSKMHSSHMHVENTVQVGDFLHLKHNKLFYIGYILH